MSESTIRTQIVAAGRRLYDRRLIAATDGNISVRLDGERILATPSGTCKGDLAPEDLVILDMQGNHLTGEPAMSSEILMHLEVYRRRADVQAVVHAHPPNCIALMLTGRTLDQPILAESVIVLGKIPVAPYARPSTGAVPSAVRPFIEQTDCILLDHHGSLTAGVSLADAFHKLDMMEHVAHAYLLALQSGQVRLLPPAEIRELTALRQSTYNLRGRLIPFTAPGEPDFR